MKKQVMKRAWEIKKEADRKTKNQLMNHNIFRELKDSEKAIFAICLKMAWDEAKKAAEYSEEYEVSMDNALEMVAKETELVTEYGGEVAWKVWRNYGKCRAYYTVSTRSKYTNSKKDNFVALTA